MFFCIFHENPVILNFILPGQSLVQGFFWMGSPVQGWPPFLGVGLSHCRILFWEPLPHFGTQLDQELQLDHPPSTAMKKKNHFKTS